jgi:hypothetical protein
MVTNMTATKPEEDQIWTRRKNEPNKGYHLFCLYRDLGPFRTIEKAHKIAVKEVEESTKINQNQPSPNIPNFNTFKTYSAKWNWIERCKAYDDFVDENFRTENERRILEMRRRHADNAKEFQEDLMKLKKDCMGLAIDDEFFKSPGGKAWFLKQVADAYGEVVMIEQDALGEPEEGEDKAKRREEFVRLFQKTEEDEDLEDDTSSKD